MAQLPPKIPPQNWSLFQHQIHHTLPNMAAPTSTHHNQPNPNLSWVDEFLGFSSTRRGHHRRSVSDGVTFIQMVDQDHQHDNAFDRLDDDQLLSMFTDDMSLDLPPPPTAMSSPLSTPSDQNSNNEDQMKACENLLQLQTMQQPDTSSKLSLDSLGLNSSTDADTKADPKRVKRILANRQSAQRSRVRKLQYISELERTVSSLQSEVSALSPRVAFLDHQRLILNVDNSSLKQRIAALAQDKLFKDAHQEALKREIERLRQIYHQQTVKSKTVQNNIGEDSSDNSSKMSNNPTVSLQQTPVQLSTPDMGIACNDK